MNVHQLPKPSDFDIEDLFYGSPLKNQSLEMTARNLVWLNRRLGDKWQPISPKLYSETFGGEEGLKALVERKLICVNDEKHISPAPAFFETFSQFIVR